MDTTHDITMSPPAAPPPFRLLLHSRDGCIPHLTPRLIRLIFSQDDEDPSKEEWQWYRRHVVLGVAVKDTCVTPIYSNKRKREDSKSDGLKKIKTSKSAVEVQSCSVVREHNDVSCDSKKPNGYTFLTTEKAAAICQTLDSHLYRRIKSIELQRHGASDTRDNTETQTSIYTHTYLRLPNFIQTMVVPTFSFAAQKIDEGYGRNGKKYVSKQSQIQQSQQSQKQSLNDNKKEQHIPNGTQKSIPIDTPHGWQCITPEQYGGAVASLVAQSTKAANNVGAVGLFDSLDVNNYFGALLEDHSGNGSSCKPAEDVGEAAAAALRKQALKKITTSFQKCTSWATRIQNSTPNAWKVSTTWIPLNIFSSFLPRHVLSKCFVSGHNGRNNILVESSNVAIVGYETIPSRFHGTRRRQLLHNLISAVQSISTSEAQHSPKQFLLLAVNDVESILDAAREGVSIIGTDLARVWSCNRIASVLDFSLPSTEGSFTSKVIPSKSTTAVRGRIDLSQTLYANDCNPILPGCTCLTCRPRQASRRPAGYQHFQNLAENSNAAIPSFSRAYIHHLIQAKEMLADTLLFIHNLHQMVLLVHHLSEAASLDAMKATSGSDRLHSTLCLERYCQWVEQQL